MKKISECYEYLEAFAIVNKYDIFIQDYYGFGYIINSVGVVNSEECLACDRNNERIEANDDEKDGKRREYGLNVTSQLIRRKK